MMNSTNAARFRVVPSVGQPIDRPTDLKKLEDILEIRRTSPEAFIASLPFSIHDATAGTENELQTVVIGSVEKVDLPLIIRASNYYRNSIEKAATGDSPKRIFTDLERHLSDNESGIWENSWVRFDQEVLDPYTRGILENDLRADKRQLAGAIRQDADRFFLVQGGRTRIRIPVSYLLKLSLAETVAAADTPPVIRETAERLMRHFSNDNTSPETYSFQPMPLTPEKKMGKGVAAEMLKRFLLTQLLVQYANRRFRLRENGQKALVYFAPHTLLRQKKLNNLISDAYYRELFMSPCLSGWDRGEDKYRYMHLCHRVLSLSQLNAVAKLREADIITRNLVVLPNTSNTCLANNGTHISLGSAKISRLLQHSASGFGERDEKHMGDLVIKIVEHFLPLFVGTYSAAPHRFDFWDFHPERMLGFLPHELHFTHLRMIWRRWKKKAFIRCLGRSVTPFGPEKLDRLVSRALGLQGDFVPDVRLIDYLVALLSTGASPALNGMPDSDGKLKKDLADMGVFDQAMPLYLLYRLRRFSQMGFSGYEGRYYSIFENVMDDMGDAVNLQVLITALAYQYILEKKISHDSIPDSPFIESERRQIFFGAAIGIPTFYIRKDTKNRLMASILMRVKDTRHSNRYGGYIRVHNLQYRRALIEMIREDGKALIELLGLQETLTNLEQRLVSPCHSAARRLTQGILDQAGASDPMRVSGEEFNAAAEIYYRDTLQKKNMNAALSLFQDDIRKLDSWQSWREGYYNQALLHTLNGKNAADYLKALQTDLLDESAGAEDLKKLIHLMLLSLHMDLQQTQNPSGGV